VKLVLDCEANDVIVHHTPIRGNDPVAQRVVMIVGRSESFAGLLRRCAVLIAEQSPCDKGCGPAKVPEV
jgi:hypothetical protein